MAERYLNLSNAGGYVIGAGGRKIDTRQDRADDVMDHYVGLGYDPAVVRTLLPMLVGPPKASQAAQRFLKSHGDPSVGMAGTVSAGAARALLASATRQGLLGRNPFRPGRRYAPSDDDLTAQWDAEDPNARATRRGVQAASGSSHYGPGRGKSYTPAGVSGSTHPAPKWATSGKTAREFGYPNRGRHPMDLSNTYDESPLLERQAWESNGSPVPFWVADNDDIQADLATRDEDYLDVWPE